MHKIILTVLSVGLVCTVFQLVDSTPEFDTNQTDAASSIQTSGTTMSSTDLENQPIRAEFASDKKLKPPTAQDVGDTTEIAIISTDKGDIVVEFFHDVAPIHVANFKMLAKAGFFDGIGFHRVLPGFVIQGGDPNTKDDNRNNDGMGGPGYSIPAEFNKIKHEKGILSMARSQDPNSGGSQFFICLDRTPHLDEQYTVFGRVIKGLPVVEKIGAMQRNPANRKDRDLPMVRMKQVRVIKRSELED